VEGGGKVPADKFLAAIVDKCQLMQPWMVVQCHYEGNLPAPEILAETSLEQAILDLLNSAPVVTPLQIEVSGWWDESRLQIRICTGGPLPSPDADAHAGVPLFARKAIAPGDRQDLFMAKTTIGRFGGTIEETAQPDGRVCIELSLPLSKFAA
jgi:two-component system sensor histidine kinase RegB